MTLLKQYFETYSVESGFDSVEEEYILGKLGYIDVSSILYPDNITDDSRNSRDSILHLFLWDLTYYSDGVVQSPNSEAFQMHERWWSESKKNNVIKCLNEKEVELSKLIFVIIKHWPFLRDDLFNEDFKQKEECETVDDYIRFIESHPQTYPEYLLEANYRIAELTDSVFEDAPKAIKEYPDSDWVKELRQRCGLTALGMTYMLSKELNDDPEDKALIISFLESFVNVMIGNQEIITMCKNLLTERLWNAVMKQSIVFRSDLSTPKLMTYKESNDFIKKLSRLVCVKFRMPTIEEWEQCACAGNMGYLFSGGNEIENVAVYSGNSGFLLQPIQSKKSNELGIYDMCGNAWEWCQSDSEESKNAPIKGGDFTSPQDWCKISVTKYVPKLSYAGCRLVVSYQ